MSLFGQVVLATSDAEGSAIPVWDLNNGTNIANLKSNVSATNSVALLGRDYVMAAQQQKDVLQFWTWHKEAVLKRCFVAEKMVSVAASPSGGHVVGGGASGTLYVWCSSTGRLLLTHKAHYKAVRCLAFTDQGHVLVSGADDTVVNCWSMMHLLDANAAASGGCQPRWSWSQHTLPVTGLAAGAGEGHSRVVSCSLDRTCRVWSVASGVCLQTLLFPSAIHCVQLPWTEHCVFAGALDGNIYCAGLWGKAGTEAAASASGSLSESEPLAGHTQAVQCLAMSGDGLLLLSGSLDGSVRVWDVGCKQMLRMLQQPGKAAVTGLIVCPRPPYLLVTGARGKDDGSSRVTAKPTRPQPLGHLSKFPGASSGCQVWEDGVIVIEGTQRHENIVRTSGLLDVCTGGATTLPGVYSHGQHGDEAAGRSGDTTDWKRQVGDLQEQVRKLKRDYAELYEEACAVANPKPVLL